MPERNRYNGKTLRRTILKEEFVAIIRDGEGIAAGDKDAAMILDKMIWRALNFAQVGDILEETWGEGENNLEDAICILKSGWIPTSASKLTTDMCFPAKQAKTVQRRLNALVEMQYLFRRSNPSEQTPEYRPNLRAIEAALISAGYYPSDWAPTLTSDEQSRIANGDGYEIDGELIRFDVEPEETEETPEETPEGAGTQCPMDETQSPDPGTPCPPPRDTESRPRDTESRPLDTESRPLDTVSRVPYIGSTDHFGAIGARGSASDGPSWDDLMNGHKQRAAYRHRRQDKLSEGASAFAETVREASGNDAIKPVVKLTDVVSRLVGWKTLINEGDDQGALRKCQEAALLLYRMGYTPEKLDNAWADLSDSDRTFMKGKPEHLARTIAGRDSDDGTDINGSAGSTGDGGERTRALREQQAALEAELQTVPAGDDPDW